MDHLSVNGEWLSRDEYRTVTSPEVRKISDLKKFLRQYNIGASDELIKTAILSTSAKNKDIILFLLQYETPQVQIEAFIKNITLLVDYPMDTLSPAVVDALLNDNPVYLKYLKPSLLSKTLFVLNISRFIDDPSLIREIIKYNPIILDYYPWGKYITKELLEELEFHSRFTIDDIRADIAELETVGVVALCHGGGYKIDKIPVPMIRFMDSPLTCSRQSDNKVRVETFKKMVARKEIFVWGDETLVYPTPSRKQQVEWAKTLTGARAEKALRRLELTEGLTDPLMSSFEPPQKVLFKEFSCSSKEFEYDGLRFLLIKGKTRTFNLFSLKTKWTMDEIFDIIQRRVALLDYSCNTISRAVDLTGIDLSKVGGKRRSRKSRKTRKR